MIVRPRQGVNIGDIVVALLEYHNYWWFSELCRLNYELR